MRKLTHTFSTLFLFPPSFFYVITRYSSGHYEQALRGEVCQNLSKTPYDADVCNFQGTGEGKRRATTYISKAGVTHLPRLQCRG